MYCSFGILEDKLVSNSIVFVVEEIDFIIHQLRILYVNNEIGTWAKYLGYKNSRLISNGKVLVYTRGSSKFNYPAREVNFFYNFAFIIYI